MCREVEKVRARRECRAYQSAVHFRGMKMLSVYCVAVGVCTVRVYLPCRGVYLYKVDDDYTSKVKENRVASCEIWGFFLYIYINVSRFVMLPSANRKLPPFFIPFLFTYSFFVSNEIRNDYCTLRQNDWKSNR